MGEFVCTVSNRQYHKGYSIKTKSIKALSYFYVFISLFEDFDKSVKQIQFRVQFFYLIACSTNRGKDNCAKSRYIIVMFCPFKLYLPNCWALSPSISSDMSPYIMSKIVLSDSFDQSCPTNVLFLPHQLHLYLCVCSFNKEDLLI